MKLTAISAAVAAVVASTTLAAPAADNAAIQNLGRRATVPGFDVSHYQSVDTTSAMSAQKSKGAEFVIIKATEGTTYTDPSFSDKYTAATNAGLIRGAYHFARPSSSSGATQANFFLAHGGGWSGDGKTLPGALDLEAGTTECSGLSQSAMVSWITDFVNTYKAKTGRPPMIYCSPAWWVDCTGGSSALANLDVPLWIANYGVSSPTIPKGWSFYSFWQKADSGTFPGDQDVFNGALTQLQTFARG